MSTTVNHTPAKTGGAPGGRGPRRGQDKTIRLQRSSLPSGQKPAWTWMAVLAGALALAESLGAVVEDGETRG